MKLKLVKFVSAIAIAVLLLVLSCAVPPETPDVPAPASTPTPDQPPSPTPTPTPAPEPPPSVIPTPEITPPLTETPSTTPLEGYSKFLPPKLAKDFYPDGLTRDKLLAHLPQAVNRTGPIEKDETWQGVIRVGGDVHVPQGVSLTIEPGTVIFVSALSDDQKAGRIEDQDLFNPKKPPWDGPSRVTIEINGSLIACGTREQPIIFTSDAASPTTDDWGSLQFNPGAMGELKRIVVEYNRILAISSGQVRIEQAILRNMMETIVIQGQGDELLTISPVITQSFIYNIGQFAITVRSGAPVITDNIIRPRQDPEGLNLPGFEYGAIAVDHPAKPTIEHNFLEGGPPLAYNEYDIWGNYREFIEATGLCFHASISPTSISYNTFYGASYAGLDAFPSPVTIEHNNFIGNRVNLALAVSFYEPSDAWQQELFEKGIIKILRAQVIQASNNYWGSSSKEEITKSMHNIRSTETPGPAQVDFEPFQPHFIEEALPRWHKFPW